MHPNSIETRSIRLGPVDWVQSIEVAFGGGGTISGEFKDFDRQVHGVFWDEFWVNFGMNFDMIFE